MSTGASAQHEIDLLGWYQLPISLAVTPGCLGKTVGVELAGRAGKLLLPRLDWRDDSPGVHAPAVPAETLRIIDHYKSGIGEGGPVNYWGGVSEWHPAKRIVHKAHISAVVLRFKAYGTEVTYSKSVRGRGVPQGDFVRNLFGSVDDWFDRLRTWIEVKRDQDLDADHPLRGVEIPGGALGLLAVDAGVASAPASASNIHINMRAEENVTLPLLRAAAREASQGRIPDDVHMLLRDSRAAIRRGQHRRAVIDAGSGLELALADFNRAVTNVNVGARATLGWYVGQPAIATGAALPSGIKQAVVDLRNDAIHQNKTPSRAEADKAFNLVFAVVNRLRPLPL